MTNPNDVLTLLQRADPVDSAALPTGDSAQARALADRIVGPPSRRLGLVLVAAVVLAAIVIATPAFGIRQAIGDLFGREDLQFEQAPLAASVTKREFADMSVGAPAGMDPSVVAGQTRLAGTFTVGGVKRRVWVAPTRVGGFCYLYEHLGGGCNNEPRRADRIQLDGSFVLRPGAQAPAMEKLAGILYDPAASTLRLTFEDERVVPLRFVYVSAPINAGFFAYNPTPGERQRGHRPLQLALLDAEGKTVARTEIDWENEDRKFAEMEKHFPPRRP